MKTLYKDVFVLTVIILSSCASTEGIGCPEPVVKNAKIAFIYDDPPGEDGLYPRDTVISVQCYRGATMKGERYVTCLETDTWEALPTCTQTTGNIQCPKPPELRNGRIERISNRWAKVSCNTGFTLYGKKRILCAMTAAGIPQWPPTLCQASNQCNNPGNITDGNWTLVLPDEWNSKTNSQFSPNTAISIVCRPGFALVGEPNVTCGMDGRWNPTIPTCEEIRCQPLNESIAHGNSGMMNRTYKQGDVVDYFCDTGYRIFGTTTRICSRDSSEGTWSHLNPVCKEIVCLRPDTIPYGGFSLESNSIGGHVTYYCNSGYQIRGSIVRHCLPSGKWSGELTSCDHDSFYCPNPGIPIGGYMENQEEENFQKGGVVRYGCHSNRALVGSAERHCDTSRSWSGEEPKCKGPYDFDDINEVAENIGFVAESLAINNTLSLSRSKGRSIDLTHRGGYDIYFVFDASGSIAKDHFDTALNFAKTLVEKIGVKNARYAASVYATRTLHSLLISDGQHSVEEVQVRIDAIAELRNSPDLGTGTATGKALQFIHTDMIPLSEINLHRPDAKKALFLFSDGHTNEGASEATPKYEAEILRDDYDVQIHCIGVTHKVDISELQDIASKPLSEHLFRIADYRELNLLAQAITKQKLDYSECGYNGGPHKAVQRTKGRIAGGEDAPLYHWPWQVALYCVKFKKPEFICGGTLIASNWVLTAAHCMVCDWDELRVYTGINDRSLINDDTTVYRVDGEDAVKTHENFNSISLDNDIALLRLTSPPPLNPSVRTICVPQDMSEEQLYSSHDAYVTGWGKTEPHDDLDCKRINKPDEDLLQQIKIPVVTNDVCEQSFGEPNAYNCNDLLDFTPAVSFCAGYLEGDRDACRGDSGGPIMREFSLSDGSKRWVQIGIVSWGEGCAQEGRYGFYTRLSTYTEWIQQHVGNSILINN